MNRWIEHDEILYNLDSYTSIFFNHDEIILFSGDEKKTYLCFDNGDEEGNLLEAKEFYEKIKSKLNLTEWE